MKRILPLIFALVFASLTSAQPLPTTKPAIVGVFLQPKRSLATWHARGVNVAIGRDTEANANGSDGVTKPQWEAACVAAGLDYIDEPGSDLATEARDPHRRGWLFVIDEIDDKIINAQDQHNAALTEALYVQLETAYQRCHVANPAMPFYVNVDGNNVQYRKVNYPRIFAASDKLLEDFYPVQRGSPVGTLGTILDNFKGIPGGNKLAIVFVEVSYQHLDPTYFHGGRGPTVGEWVQQVNLCTSRNLSVAWFPQCIGGDGKAGFSTDATDPTIAVAMTTWLAPAVATPAIITKPTLPVTITVPGYTPQTFQLQPQQ